ncbi:unnamed protein product, partial [Rotaria socialis]
QENVLIGLYIKRQQMFENGCHLRRQKRFKSIESSDSRNTEVSSSTAAATVAATTTDATKPLKQE